MKNKKGNLFVLTGASGSGKGTVLKKLLEQREDVFLSVSATTRQPRLGETHGTSYYFLSQQEFKTRIEMDDMLEYACYNGNYYGTPKSEVLKHLEQGHHVILEIEVQGALQVKKEFPQACFIFITPPSLEVLRQRLVGRGTESIEEIENRLHIAKSEYQQVGEYHYVIINDELDQALLELDAIINSFSTRIEERMEYMQGEFL